MLPNNSKIKYFNQNIKTKSGVVLKVVSESVFQEIFTYLPHKYSMSTLVELVDNVDISQLTQLPLKRWSHTVNLMQTIGT